MSHLKKEMANKCVSLLREYIDESPLSDKKKTAVLALEQLQKITAGTSPSENFGCGIIPRIDGNPAGTG